MGVSNEERLINVGCCGFAASQKKYFELFDVVEIQQTFYQIPEIKTATFPGQTSESDV